MPFGNAGRDHNVATCDICQLSRLLNPCPTVLENENVERNFVDGTTADFLACVEPVTLHHEGTINLLRQPWPLKIRGCGIQNLKNLLQLSYTFMTKRKRDF